MKPKIKRPKDPHKPKISQSPYFLFNNQVRASFRQKYPDKTPGERAKLVAAKWNQMSKNEKKPYNEKAARLKKEYLKQMKQYQSSQYYQDHQNKLKDWKQRCSNIKKGSIVNSNDNIHRKKNWKEFKVWRILLILFDLYHPQNLSCFIRNAGRKKMNRINIG